MYKRQDPEEIVLNAGCTSCHKIGELGESHKVGPDLSDIGWLAQGRVEGMTAEDYILQSLIDPNVYLAPECPNGPCLANIMPRDYAQRLTPEQQEDLVAFLSAQQTAAEPENVAAPEVIEPSSEALPAAEQSGARNYGVTAVRVASILLLSLVFLVSLFIYLRGEAGGNDEGS